MVLHGDKLRELRTKMHLSQEALATQLGVAKSAISQYECGKRTPEFAIAQKICMFFDCKLSDIADVPELIPFLGHDPFGMEKNRSQSNINIGTNNGAVSGSGNVTYVKESHVTYGAVQSECMRLIEALFGDSPEALTYMKSLKISQSEKIEGLENIDVTSKALLDGARTTWIAALRNALEKGTDRVQIPV